MEDAKMLPNSGVMVEVEARMEKERATPGFK
jgi:hypothetical protein